MRRVWILLALLLPSFAVAQTARVGLTTRVFHPAAKRNWRGSERKELRVMIWYPAVESAVETRQTVGPPDAPLFEAGSAAPHAEFKPALGKFPLILLSHGSGGSAVQMAWLGTALARAGFIAAAVDHPGNNSGEPYTAEGFVLWWERATDLTEVLDGVLADGDVGSHVDATRIGAAGFSIGGYTVLELAGALTDISTFYDHCREQPMAADCGAPETRAVGSGEQMLAATRKSSGASLAQSAESYRDARIKAVLALAPAQAQVLTRDSLRDIRLPIELMVGALDRNAPAAANADYLRANLHGARETVLPGVGHYTFLDTCTGAGKAALKNYCTDDAGVDRDAVHTQVVAAAATFFARALHVGKSR